MKNQEKADIESLRQAREHFFGLCSGKLGWFALKSYSNAIEKQLVAVFERMNKGKAYCFVAVGGFGRAELCYGSDIDFMILANRFSKKEAYQINNRLSDLLWKAGFSVGNSVRTISECIGESKDITVRVSLIDSRFLAGDRKLYDKYSKKVLKYITCHNKENLLKELVYEVKRRRIKYPDNFISEPDLKEGVGTQRDYNTICWIDKIVPLKTLLRNWDYENLYSRLEEAADFIFRLRNAVNMRTPKDNCLRFELQEEIAEQFGYFQEDACIELMRQFFRRSLFLEEILDILAKAIEGCKNRKQINDCFYICGNRLEIDEGKTESLSKIDSDAVIFWFLVKYQLDMGAKLKQFLMNTDNTRQPSSPAISLFAKTLSLKKPVSRQLMAINRLGILSRYIPEFERIKFLMPHLLFHEYSVDVHSIGAVGKMDEIMKKNEGKRLFGTLSSIIGSLDKNGMLAMRLTLLLHDIGKYDSLTTGHSERGARMFEAIAKRFGLSSELSKLGAKAIEHHLLMNKIIRKRDISDPLTIKEFAERIQDKIALKWLLLLTYADMSSVNSSLWNEWYEILADQLYTVTVEFFEKRDWTSIRSIENRKKFLSLYGDKMPYLANFSDRFFNDITEDELKYIDIAKKTGYAVKEGKGFEKLFVWKRNRVRLMADITGILFYKEINILAGTTYIIGDDVVDLFMIKVPENFIEKDWKSLGKLINSAETLQIEKMLEEKERYSYARATKAKFVSPKITVDQRASDLYTVVDVKAADRMGLLYNICVALSNLNCDIIIFKLSTVSDMASDSFYITGHNGGKIFDKKELDKIIESIRKKIS